MPELEQNIAKFNISHPKNCPKTLKILPKWQFFGKYGHTGSHTINLRSIERMLIPENCCRCSKNTLKLFFFFCFFMFSCRCLGKNKT